MFKIGLDLHGVLDTYDSIVKLSQILNILPNTEVHIITGNSKTPEVLQQLTDLGVRYSHFFSITDHLERRGLIEWRDGYPWTDDNIAWDESKAIYCKENEIDILLDDSLKYGKYFDDIKTIYCHIQNPKRIEYKMREK